MTGDDNIAALKAEVERLRARVAELEADPASEVVLRSVTANAPDNVMLLDLDGRIRFINFTVPDLTVEQVLGTPVTEFVPQEYCDTITQCLTRVRQTGEPDRYETTYIAEDGEISYWESRVSPMWRGSRIIGFVCHSSNITERRRAAAQRDRFFNLSLDMLCVASTEGYFTRVNPAFERSLGYTERELLTTPFIDFIHPDDHETTRAAVARLREGRDVIDFENRYRRKDGEYRWLSWRGTAERGTDVIYAIARDVTDRRVMEEQIRQSQKMDAVGQLAGGIAHDFNNLVLAIQINTEFARGKASSPDELARHLDEVQRATQRAAELTRQLLAFSRRQSIDARDVAVDTIVEDLLQLLRRLIPENIAVSLTTAPELPAVAGDASQIEQLVMNLCVNARDAMPQGGTLRIAIDSRRLDSEFCMQNRWARPGNYLRIEVSDSGEGIPAEVRERIFEPFFTTKEPGRGTGLGLATAYGITKQHGGFIHVDSEPGNGANFQVFLPSLDRPTRARQAREAHAGAGPGGRGETVLVAEDDDMVRKVVVELLEQAGYNVIQAADGQAAVDIFRQHADSVDVVLLDVMMPNMGGSEALAHMRALRPQLRAIISTGYSGDAWKKGSLVPETVVQKPYQAETLLAKLRNALDR